MGTNGKVYIGQDTTTADTTAAPQAPAPAVAPLDLSKLPLMMLPTTPVAFSGTEGMIAWLRILGYGAIAYATWGKARTISYVAMGAAGVSIATSLGASAMRK